LRNLSEESTIQKAQYAFEVSSEGELEQVRFLMDKLLEEGKTIEIILCSESVEEKIVQIRKKFPMQVRVLRLPILRFNPIGHKTNAYNWLSASTFVMCRYDFFPELIFYGRKKSVNFILISAIFSTFAKKKWAAKSYLKFVYNSFNKIVCATDYEKNKMLKTINYSGDIFSFDFRCIQILKRQSAAEYKIPEYLPYGAKLIQYLKENISNTYVFGSFWSDELPIFDNVDFVKNKCFIVPHNLGVDEIQKIKSYFLEKNIKVFELKNSQTKKDFEIMIDQDREFGGVWLFNIKGLLCELYTLFNAAYIGGGFGDSIHSVLEPHLAKNLIVCGPKIERSTEYQMIKNLSDQLIYSVSDHSLVFPTLCKMRSNQGDLDSSSIELYTSESRLLFEKLFNLNENANVK